MKPYELPSLGYDYAAPENRRADYVNAIWNVVNWSDVSARFERVRSLISSAR